ncbi:MAG: thioredoxin domain-containing protein [Bdellovibrionota bacterium]
MKSLSQKLLLSVVVIAGFYSCAPNADQLKKAIEKDPDIVFTAIQKNPERFIEVVNEAAQKAQQGSQSKAMEEEKKKRDDEFANPLKPTIPDDAVIFGNKSAPITIVEYSDFECPFCTRGYQTIKQVKQTEKNSENLVYAQMPLEFHPKAMPAAKYFTAISMQGNDKAEKFHDYVFENQNELKAPGDAFLKKAAKQAGADLKKLEKDLNDPSVQARVNADIEEAKKFGINGTPGFIINGVSLRGAYPFDDFKQIIDRQLATK